MLVKNLTLTNSGQNCRDAGVAAVAVAAFTTAAAAVAVAVTAPPKNKINIDSDVLFRWL